jgi:hypothetical protein
MNGEPEDDGLAVLIERLHAGGFRPDHHAFAARDASAPSVGE